MFKSRKLLLVIAAAIAVLFLAAFSNSNDDRAVIFNNIEVGSDEVVNGDVVSIFGSVKNSGVIKGDVAAIFGNVSLSGRIEGDTAAVFGSVKLEEGAVIAGDTAAIGGGIDRAPGSEIKGEIADVGIPFAHNTMKPASKVNAISIIGLIVLYGLACLTFFIIPERINCMSVEFWKRIPRRFGVGIAAFVLSIPIIIALIITLIGILAIPFFILAFILLVFVAKVAMYMAIGHRITGNLSESSAAYIYMLVGAVLVFTLNIIPIFGLAANTIITCIALGAAIDTKIGGGRLIKAHPFDEAPAEALHPLEIPKQGGNE